MKLGVFAEQMLFIKISLLSIFSLPSPILPTEEREKTEKTTAQLPANKKCCLLIFAIAIGCLVLGDFPPSIPSFPSGHSGTSGIAVPLPLGCPALRGPRNARGVLGCTLRFRLRDSPRLYTLHSTPYTAALLPPLN